MEQSVKSASAVGEKGLNFVSKFGPSVINITIYVLTRAADWSQEIHTAAATLKHDFYLRRSKEYTVSSEDIRTTNSELRNHSTRKDGNEQSKDTPLKRFLR